MSTKKRTRAAALTLTVGIAALNATAGVTGEPWTRHTIDNTSHGADGARPADVNGNGLPDLAVAWEEGGVVRVYLHPGFDAVREPWPMATVGEVPSPEDAVFADIDGGGHMDVISATEDHSQTMFVHWAPADPADYLKDDAWTTEAIPASRGVTRWMYAVPRMDGQGRLEIVAGSKMPNATVGVFRLPSDPRDVAGWTFTPLARASWIMSLEMVDWGGGQPRLLYSDRKDPQTRGVWLEEEDGAFTRLGGEKHEVMFLGTGPLEPDGPVCIVAATRDNGLLVFEPHEDGWHESVIPMPPGTGTGKGVAIGDVDGDGRPDIVFSCEHADRKHGVVYLSRKDGREWTAHAISGLEGVKFDQVELIDMDGDGDLDVVTCEETTGLGVVWYENPLK